LSDSVGLYQICQRLDSKNYRQSKHAVYKLQIRSMVTEPMRVYREKIYSGRVQLLSLSQSVVMFLQRVWSIDRCGRWPAACWSNLSLDMIASSSKVLTGLWSSRKRL